jgi:predicted nucleic acid-binding protein
VIHLDTSFLIYALIPHSIQDQQLRRWLREGETLVISSIAWTELRCGPIDTSRVELARRVVTEVLPYLEEDATTAAGLFNKSGRRRGSLSDCMIAAVALREGAPVATANPADFRRFEEAGLQVVVP